jgi:hypothetical protein
VEGVSSEHKIIRILLEGEPEYTFIKERIIEKYKFCFPNVDFKVLRIGTKSELLSEQILFENYLRLCDKNMICIFLPDFHPVSSHNYDHSSIETLRSDIYSVIDRLDSSVNIKDYKERFLIHTFKHGGDIIFLANLELLLDELGIIDDDFIAEIKSDLTSECLEDLDQNPEEESHEKRILKKILKKANKSYSIKHLRNIILKLKIKLLIQELPHFKIFLIDLFKSAEDNKECEEMREKLGLL